MENQFTKIIRKSFDVTDFPFSTIDRSSVQTSPLILTIWRVRMIEKNQIMHLKDQKQLEY